MRGARVQHVHHERLERLRVVAANGRELALRDLMHERRQVRAVERALQARALVHDAAERPHVGLLVVRLAFAHLRRDVVRRAEYRNRRAARRRQLL